MMRVEASQDIDASVDGGIGFVMDVDRYRQADDKIRRIRRLERHDDDEVVVAMWTSARGMPLRR